MHLIILAMSTFLCQMFGISQPTLMNQDDVMSLTHAEAEVRQLIMENKKAQLSLTNPRDTKACQRLLQFDVLTTLSLTILAYLHAFNCCCVRNLRNPKNFTENSNF